MLWKIMVQVYKCIICHLYWMVIIRSHPLSFRGGGWTASLRNVLGPSHLYLLLDQPSIQILLEGEFNNGGSIGDSSKSIHDGAWQRVDRQIPHKDGGDGRIRNEHAQYRWM